MATTSGTNSISLVNHKLFDKYDIYKEHLDKKVFLYSEIHPKKDDTLKFNDEEYSISDTFDIQVIGSVTNPKRSLKSILSSCYKCEEFLVSADGFLFVYSGFKSSQEEFKISESAVQLKFKVYKLIKS